MRVLVEELLGAGHAVAIARFAPDAAVDLAAMTAADAEAALAALDPVVKLVAVSTIESYRVFDSIYAGTVTDAVPLAEDAPLREGPYPPRSRPSPRAGTTTPTATTSSRSSASTWSAARRSAGCHWSTARATTSAVRTSCSPGCAPAASGSRTPSSSASPKTCCRRTWD